MPSLLTRSSAPLSPHGGLAGAAVAIAMLGAAGDLAATPVVRYDGVAYDARDRVLYRESHGLRGDHGARTLVVLFECPDGKAFARKRVDENGTPEAPSFALEDARSGYREGVRAAGGDGREVFVQRRAEQAEKSAPLPVASDLVLDAGFDAFIRGHWDALASGRRMTMAFLVPSRLSTVPFSVERVGETTVDGAPATRFRLEVDAWYAFALPAIDATYVTATRTIRTYNGPANVRNADGKPLDVRIEFPSSDRHDDADAAAFERLATAPLDGRCIL